MQNIVDFPALLKTVGVSVTLLLLSFVISAVKDIGLIYILMITPVWIGFVYGYFSTQHNHMRQFITGSVIAGALHALILNLVNIFPNIGGAERFFSEYLFILLRSAILCGAVSGFLWAVSKKQDNLKRIGEEKSFINLAFKYLGGFSFYVFPILAIITIYGTWFAAREILQLDSSTPASPFPIRNSPHSISPIIGDLSNIASYLLIIIPAAFFFAFQRFSNTIGISNKGLWVSGEKSWLFSLLWVSMLIFFVLDPGNAVSWIFD